MDPDFGVGSPRPGDFAKEPVGFEHPLNGGLEGRGDPNDAAIGAFHGVLAHRRTREQVGDPKAAIFRIKPVQAAVLVIPRAFPHLHEAAIEDGLPGQRAGGSFPVSEARSQPCAEERREGRSFGAGALQAEVPVILVHAAKVARR